LLDEWTDWIEDEWNMAEGPEEKKNVLKFCEQALYEVTCKANLIALIL
jgi:hypothetical protein